MKKTSVYTNSKKRRSTGQHNKKQGRGQRGGKRGELRGLTGVSQAFGSKKKNLPEWENTQMEKRK